MATKPASVRPPPPALNLKGKSRFNWVQMQVWGKFGFSVFYLW